MSCKCIDQEASLHRPTDLRLLRYTVRYRISRRRLRLLKKPTITKESSDDEGDNPSDSATHFCGGNYAFLL